MAGLANAAQTFERRAADHLKELLVIASGNVNYSAGLRIPKPAVYAGVAGGGALLGQQVNKALTAQRPAVKGPPRPPVAMGGLPEAAVSTAAVYVVAAFAPKAISHLSQKLPGPWRQQQIAGGEDSLATSDLLLTPWSWQLL